MSTEVIGPNRVMEVNNNDPNNNDVILETSEDQQELDETMGVGSSTMSSQLTDDIDPSDSEQSETLSFSRHSAEPTIVISDDDQSNEYNSEEEEELDLEDYYGTEESDLEEEEEEINEEESEEEEPQDDAQDDAQDDVQEPPVPSSSGSTSTSLQDDFNLIKKITPRLSDKKIMKYLKRNEDHDHRLFAAVWDLMHAVNKPRSKNSEPPSPVAKKAKPEWRMLPVPGKPEIFINGKTKIQNPVQVQLPEQNPELLNRKDYKRAPKRATVPTEAVETKRMKGPEESQAGPSQAPATEPMETNVVAPVNLVAENLPVVIPVFRPTYPITAVAPNPVVVPVREPQNLVRPATFNPAGSDVNSQAFQQAVHATIKAQLNKQDRRRTIPPVAKPQTLVKSQAPNQLVKYQAPIQLAKSQAPIQLAKSQAPIQVERKQVQPNGIVQQASNPNLVQKLVLASQPSSQLIRPAVFNGPPPPPLVHLPGPSTVNNVNNGASTSAGPSTSAPSTSKKEEDFDFDEGLKRLKNQYVFKHLSAMFGQVSRKKVLKLCLEHDDMTQDDMVELLTDKLLAKVTKMDEKRKAEAEKKPEVNQPTEIQDLQALLQEKTNDLIDIFPDADPEYLRQNAIKYLNDPQKFKEFVQTNLENKNYPSKEEYLKKQKVRKQLEQYISQFDVKQFLEIFPDPFGYFEDPNRKTEYSHLSWNFLKNHFNKTRERVIKSAFDKNKKNLSLTAKELDHVKGDMKTKRYQQTLSYEDIPFAQEVAFIKHRLEIRDYLSSIKQKERLEFEQCQKSGGLLECQCCFSDECIPSKCGTCENGHIFCFACIVRGTESKMADGETHVKCFVECDSEFSLSVLQKVLQPKKFSILLTKRQEAEVKAAGLEGLVSCPFCHFASIPPAGDKVFKCLNQDCMKESCRACKDLNHVPLSCTEAKASDKARHFLEERMTEALIRICYSCKKPFFKEEGCNKMTCNCGAKMCYICGQPVKDYTHFRGQGSDNENLCPLYTDDARLNAETVRREAQRTAENLRARDPSVKLDTEKLMPALPAPKQGPHNHILGRVDVPVRIQNNFQIRNNVIPNNNPGNNLLNYYDQRIRVMQQYAARQPRIVVDRQFDNRIHERLQERIRPAIYPETIDIVDDIPDDVLANIPEVNPNVAPVNELPYL